MMKGSMQSCFRSVSLGLRGYRFSPSLSSFFLFFLFFSLLLPLSTPSFHSLPIIVFLLKEWIARSLFSFLLPFTFNRTNPPDFPLLCCVCALPAL